jgi:hypothetical protein
MIHIIKNSNSMLCVCIYIYKIYNSIINVITQNYIILFTQTTHVTLLRFDLHFF